ncbi:hypothetical protein GCM10027174_36940 [Salinifilum aidingensis]
MIYVLAAIGAVALIVLVWKAFGPTPDQASDDTPRQAPLAPDDDPEFLRRIDEQQRKSNNSDEGE